MGERSLNEQLNHVCGIRNIYREGLERDMTSLKEAQGKLDEASANLSVAETAWRKAKDERDMIMVKIADCKQRIRDLDDEQQMIERKLTEIRTDKLAKEPY